MEPQSMSEDCVYTIVDGKKLARLAKGGRAQQFEERKRWVTAAQLWQNARSANRTMPVLFGDAAHCSRLLFWGVLTDLHVGDEATRFTVDRLRKLNGKHSPQELVLRSSGRKIAPQFIRPYAICVTPQFVSPKDAV